MLIKIKQTKTKKRLNKHHKYCNFDSVSSSHKFRIWHVLTPDDVAPRQRYGKFTVCSRPMRIREYTAMNNECDRLFEGNFLQLWKP